MTWTILGMRKDAGKLLLVWGISMKCALETLSQKSGWHIVIVSSTQCVTLQVPIQYAEPFILDNYLDRQVTIEEYKTVLKMLKKWQITRIW